MLPKENRLKKKKDFEGVFGKGKIFFEEFLGLKAVKNNLEKSRFGFVVSQKISKKAVVRNKVKRRLREAVRGELENIGAGYDAVFFTKKGIEEKDFREIKWMIKKLLERAKLLTN